MPKRKIDFVDGEIYHIMLRGVDGRQIFMDDEDRWRGIFGLYEFNTTQSITIREQREKREKFKESLNLPRDPASEKLEQEDKRIKLVEIISFVFMTNHIHLLVRQVKPNGVTQFIKKFGGGYAMYFNTRYERKGVLFQGRFQATHVGDDEYLKTVFVYIHTNPISLVESKWKEGGITDRKKTKEFIEEYRWSSYLDYLGKKNFPSITERDFMIMVFDDRERIREFVDAWIEFKSKPTRQP